MKQNAKAVPHHLMMMFLTIANSNMTNAQRPRNTVNSYVDKTKPAQHLSISDQLTEMDQNHHLAKDIFPLKMLSNEGFRKKQEKKPLCYPFVIFFQSKITCIICKI